MPSVTLGELDTRLLGGKLENNSDFYTQAERYRSLNHAVKVLNLMTGFVQRTVSIYTQAGRTIYDVPAGILVPVRIDIDGRFLEKTGMYGLSHAHPTWILDTTATTGVPVQEWAPIGVKKFALHPGDANGGALLTITGVAEPTPLTSSSHVIAFPDSFGDGIVDYAAHLLMVKAAGTVAVQAMYSYSSFMSRMSELRRFKAKIAPTFKIEAEAKE